MITPTLAEKSPGSWRREPWAASWGDFRRTGELLDVSAHRSEDNLIIELEAASLDARPTSNVLDGLAEAAAGFELSVISRLSATGSI